MTEATLVNPIAQAVHDLMPDKTVEAVRVALEAGVRPVEILDLGIARGMELVGEDYQRETMFLPELLMAEQCMRSGLVEIESFVGEEGAPLVDAAQQWLAERATSWIPALSSCVTRLLHSSDSFLKTR